jgi:hypothetical protein
MKTPVSLLLSIIFLFLAAIHIYWGFGGKSGSAASVPAGENNKPVLKPGKFECFVVALGLLGFGVFVLIKAGIILSGLPNWLLQYGLWAIIALFVLRAVGEFKYIGFFKKIKTTQFGQLDTKYYSPLCLLIGLLGTILEFLN